MTVLAVFAALYFIPLGFAQRLRTLRGKGHKALYVGAGAWVGTLASGILIGPFAVLFLFLSIGPSFLFLWHELRIRKEYFNRKGIRIP